MMTEESKSSDHSLNRELLTELTADVVAAYVSNNVVQSEEIASLIENVHSALGKTCQVQSASHDIQAKPAVSIKKSVQDNVLYCLECGLQFKSLKRHLLTCHNLTPEQYRAKWDLPANYPMVAPAYAETRSTLAKKMKLGHKRR